MGTLVRIIGARESDEHTVTSSPEHPLYLRFE